jgi:hypothetical protein
MLPNLVRSVAATAIICAALFPSTSTADDERRPIVCAERMIDGARVQVIEYREQYGEPVPAFGDRNWRSILCVEVTKATEREPRRVWQFSTIGQEFFSSLHSFVLSDASGGRFVLAYCGYKSVLAALVDENGKVDPLPAEMKVDPQTLAGNWKNPPILPVPDGGRYLKPLGKQEIGFDLTASQQISLKSATKTNSGWRIEATVDETNHPPSETRLPNGVIRFDSSPVPILRFVVILDEECTQAKIEVLKADDQKQR